MGCCRFDTTKYRIGGKALPSMLCRLSTGWADEMPVLGRLKADEVEEG